MLLFMRNLILVTVLGLKLLLTIVAVNIDKEIWKKLLFKFSCLKSI